uniref:Uncharacterized protein n=1 Tax=Rhizophora mucronata TaxID=61149 RepID=A0A2P2QFE7_RHIMU
MGRIFRNFYTSRERSNPN